MDSPVPALTSDGRPDPEPARKAARLGEEITELAAHIHAATFVLLKKIREFDELKGWNQDGVLSCAHWLQWRCGMSI